MASRGFLVVSVVMGLLSVGAAVVVARSRRRETPARPSLPGRRAPALAAGSAGRRSDAAALGAVAALAAFLGVAAVVDAVLAVIVALSATVVGYFAWGMYSLARARGLPRAHAVGLSAWLFALVLIGVLAVKLLFG
ncbi:hypothetical protein [Haloplanus halophilus]|uniref:hypothetical protein n=1 Tax=Haloplanus halophilus TaxID=2949993 RepID=UPI00203D79FF|nr:hypothetical protein [Haloplanus sp. GDY1]